MAVTVIVCYTCLCVKGIQINLYFGASCQKEMLSEQIILLFEILQCKHMHVHARTHTSHKSVNKQGSICCIL